MRLGRPKTLARRDLLFREGDTFNSLVLAEAGMVKLTQLGKGGNEVILWLRGPGDVIAPTVITVNGIRTCTATAVLSSRLLIWEWTTLEREFFALNKLRGNLDSIASDCLSELEVRFREIATENVACRVALAVTRMARQIGRPVSEGIELCLSREELAQLTGTSLFTVSRLISRWKDMKLVEPRREAVVICNIEGLAHLADNDHET